MSSGGGPAANETEQRKKSLATPWALAAGLLAIALLVGFGWYHFPATANFNSTTILTHPSHQLSRYRTEPHLLSGRQPCGI